MQGYSVYFSDLCAFVGVMREGENRAGVIWRHNHNYVNYKFHSHFGNTGETFNSERSVNVFYVVVVTVHFSQFRTFQAHLCV